MCNCLLILTYTREGSVGMQQSLRWLNMERWQKVKRHVLFMNMTMEHSQLNLMGNPMG